MYWSGCLVTTSDLTFNKQLRQIFLNIQQIILNCGTDGSTMSSSNISTWNELDLVYLTGQLKITDESVKHVDRATRAASFANLPEEILVTIFMHLDGDAKL